MNTQTLELGPFEILSGKAHISDPCYDIGTWCAGTIMPVKNGRWEASVIKSDEGDWGVRCAVLLAHHGAHHVNYDSKKFKLQGFEVGVDSGQAGIYDRDSFEGGKDNYGDGGWYDDNCNVTKNPFDAGVLPDGHGVVSSSGFGDGGYRCYAIRDKNDDIIAIKVDFGLLGDE